MKKALILLVILCTSGTAWSFITVIDYRDVSAGVSGTIQHGSQVGLKFLQNKELTYRGNARAALELMNEVADNSILPSLVVRGTINSETGVVEFYCVSNSWTAQWTIRPSEPMALKALKKIEKVSIDPTSVRVVRSSTVLDGYHELAIEMLVLPENECQADVTSLYDVSEKFQDPVLIVLASAPRNGCDLSKASAPVKVVANVVASVRSNHSLTLDGVEFWFTGTGKQVRIDR